MGLFSRLAKSAATLNAPKPIQSTSTVTGSPQQMTTTTGEVSPPATGEPIHVKLKGGKDVELLVNTQGISEAAARELFGRPKDDDEEVDKTVRLWMSRDLESQYPDSVRVQTRKGKAVGWIRKDQSYFACELIDQIGGSLAQQDPSLLGRAPHLNVSAGVFGAWLTEYETDEDGNDLDDEKLVPEVDGVAIRLPWPVVMEAHGDDALK